MKILFLNWKDDWAPGSGGAEVVHTNIIQRLVRDGYEVTLLTQRYTLKSGELSMETEYRDGYKIIRVGTNMYLHTLQASLYYYIYLRNKHDVVISCNNTAPYFVGLLKGKESHYSFYHQLAREVWWYETVFPLNYIGYYLLEPVATLIQAITNKKVITISKSTRDELMRFGFRGDNISILTQGSDMIEIKEGEYEKYNVPTILYFGALRSMKRPDQVVKAFELAKERVEGLELIIAGSGSGEYVEKLNTYIESSKYKSSIKMLGRVDTNTKLEVMSRSHLICVTSVKEGWGLIVTEAAKRGTPAIVYNVDGLRDSVIDSVTGVITNENNPKALSQEIVNLLQDKDKYDIMRLRAINENRKYTFDNQYLEFCEVTKVNNIK